MVNMQVEHNVQATYGDNHQYRLETRVFIVCVDPDALKPFVEPPGTRAFNCGDISPKWLFWKFSGAEICGDSPS